MTTIKANQVLECEGLACPMPVVKTRKAMEELNPGEVLEVRTTDKGSVADLQSWSNRTGQQYVGLKEEEGIYRHFLRKSSKDETKSEVTFPHTITNEELIQKLASSEKLNVLDVREPAEYAFGRIPGAISIPLGELERKLEDLNKDELYFVICRTGVRSDMACQILANYSFTNVKNVIPGMSEWQENTEQD